MPESDVEHLRRKIFLLEEALLSAAGVLIDVQFVIAELRAASSSPETPQMKKSVKSLSDRMDKLIDRLQASVDVK